MCVCLHFVKCLKSPLPTVCPVPAELGLDCAVLVDKSLYGRFLNLSPVGIWVWIICCGDCRCILEWLAAFLASSHWMPVTSPELVQPKISLGLCQKSPEWQKSPRLKITDLECLSVSPVPQLWAFPSHLVSPCCQPCSQPLPPDCALLISLGGELPSGRWIQRGIGWGWSQVWPWVGLSTQHADGCVFVAAHD